MYGNEGCCHEGHGRGMRENEHQHHRGSGCCGEEGYESGFKHRFMDDLYPSRESLQKTLEWLKNEKTELEKRIKDLEVLLKGEQG
jgi:hypothetical protein